MDLWRKEFRELDQSEKDMLLSKLSGVNDDFTDARLLSFYRITKRQVETKKVHIESYQ